MKVNLIRNQKLLWRALNMAEFKVEGETDSVFDLQDWLRILAFEYGADELRAAVAELIEKLAEENT
jgi:hypothetical protein